MVPASRHIEHHRGFTDELQKLAVEPIMAAGLAVAGKSALLNTLRRVGPNTRPGRFVLSELLGVGLRRGLAGKPMPSGLARDLFAVQPLGGDPALVELYELAHGVGQAAHSNPTLAGALRKAVASSGRLAPEAAKPYMRLFEQAPVESVYLHQKLLDAAISPIAEKRKAIAEFLRLPVSEAADRAWQFGQTPVFGGPVKPATFGEVPLPGDKIRELKEGRLAALLSNPKAQLLGGGAAIGIGGLALGRLLAQKQSLQQRREEREYDRTDRPSREET